MDWQWTTASLVLFSTSGLALTMSALLFRRRAIRGVGTLAALMVVAAYYAAIAGFEAAAVPLASKILFSKLEYVASGSAPLLFLLFALRHTGRNAWATGLRGTLLWILPLVSIPLAATNEYHQLVWTGFSPGAPGSNAVIYQHGPAFFVLMAAICVYLFIGSILLIDSAVRSPTVRRRQSILCLLGVAVPWASIILYSLGITFLPGLNLPPLSFSVAGVILAIGVVPLRLFELLPVARDLLIESMSDGILVVDAERRIVDMNPAVRKLLDLSPSSIGDDAGQALHALPQLVACLDTDREVDLSITVSADPLLHLDLRVIPLRPSSRERAGLLIVARDVSKRYRAERSLQEANLRLQAQVREIERLQEELHDQAIRDPLTGLFNRRYLDDALPRLLERAARSGTPVSVVLFDLDHFKEVNDTHGHRAGDALLTRLAELFSRQTRPGDIASRYGGDESVLVLPQTPLDVALERADSIRRAFRAVSLPDLRLEKAATLSAGVAAFPTHGRTQDELLRAADLALYTAKEEGRDTVRCAQVKPD